jgi:hypothetical protein
MIRHRQNGAATLIFSIVILLLISAVSLYTAKSIYTEMKISGNELRSKRAFEAAEQGLSVAMNAFNEGKRPTLAGGMFGGGNSTNGTVLNGLAQYEVSVISGAPIVECTEPYVCFTVISVGTSDDGSASKTITDYLVAHEPLANDPENPVTARGSVNISGNASVFNPEGASTIWSGGNVAIGSGETFIADPSGGSYPSCLESSFTCDLVTASDDTVGVDIIANDTTLGSLSNDELFLNFFGNTFQNYYAQVANVRYTGPGGSLADDAIIPVSKRYGSIIHIRAAGSVTGGGNLTLGCSITITGGGSADPPSGGTDDCTDAGGELAPVVLVIEGDLVTSGTLHLFGLVFITGDITGSGSVDISGAMIMGGSSDTTGSLNVKYNSDILELLGSISVTPGSAEGGWRDF